MAESRFQAQLIKELGELFPDCWIMKNDPQYQQGVLDLTILWGLYWAMLEVKASAKAPMRPNQDYFVQKLNEMSFAAVIYPENKEEVLRGLQQAFAPRRRARISQS